MSTGYAKLTSKLSGGHVRPQTKTNSNGKSYGPIRKSYVSPRGTLPTKYNQLA